jgi:hypothetical protein
VERRPRGPRRAAALPALAVLAVVVAACGGGDGGRAAAPATVTVTRTDVVTVTVTAEPPTTTAGEGLAGGSTAALAAPTPAQGGAILAAVAEVVLQCRSVAAGFVEEPEPEALERSLDVLADAAGRLDRDAPFATGGGTDLAGTTTLGEQLGLARRQLAGGCAPELASRLD